MVVRGASSPDSPVLSGVPQGSVLGPLLFLIYIDDVSSLQLSENSVLNLYADDMLLYKQIKCSEDYQQLQMDIDKISSWVDHNNLSLNPAKCKTMLLSRKRNLSHPPQLLLNEAPLEQVSTWEYSFHQTCLGPGTLTPSVQKERDLLACYTEGSPLM